MKHIRRFSENLMRSPTKSVAPPLFEAEDVADPIQLHLNGASLIYEKREWICDSGGGANSAIIKELQERNNALEVENQMLKFKIGVMLDMLATTKIDVLMLNHKTK